jgi:hypothetical protein
LIDTTGDRSTIADGKARRYVDTADIINRSKVSDTVKPGDLRHWSVSEQSDSVRTFMIVTVRSDDKGGIVCDIMDEDKLFVMSLGSVLLVSDLLG